MRRTFKTVYFYLLISISFTGKSQSIWRFTLPIESNNPYESIIIEPIIIKDTVYIGERYFDTLVVNQIGPTGLLISQARLAQQFPNFGLLPQNNGHFLTKSANEKLNIKSIWSTSTKFVIDQLTLSNSLQILSTDSTTFNHAINNDFYFKYRLFANGSFALIGARYFQNPFYRLPALFFFNSSTNSSTVTQYDSLNSSISFWNEPGNDFYFNQNDSCLLFFCGYRNNFLLRLNTDLSIRNMVSLFPNNTSGLSKFWPSGYSALGNRLLLGGVFAGYSAPEYFRSGLTWFNPINDSIIDSIASPSLTTHEKWFAKQVMADSSTIYLAEVNHIYNPWSTTEMRWVGLFSYTPSFTQNWNLILGPTAGYETLNMKVFSDGSLLILNRFYDGNKWMLELLRIDRKGNYVGLNESTVVNNSCIVYPNPFQQQLEIKFLSQTAQKASLTLLDVTGKMVQQQEVNVTFSNTHTLNTQHLPAGVYMLTLADAQGNVLQRQKVVKQ